MTNIFSEFGRLEKKAKNKLMPKVKEFGRTAKLIGYDLPKAIIRKSITNANQTDVFPELKKKKGK